MTRDRIQDGRNWYAYCDNNPLKLSDPSGLSELDSATHSRNFKLTYDLIRSGDAPSGVIIEWLKNFKNILASLGLKLSEHAWERILERFPDIQKLLWILQNGTVYSKNGETWIVGGGSAIRVVGDVIITVVNGFSKRGAVPIESASDYFRRLLGG